VNPTTLLSSPAVPAALVQCCQYLASITGKIYAVIILLPLLLMPLLPLLL
jgi:hypothetical protein